MIRLNDIIDKTLSYYPDADPGLIQKAYVFSAKVHKGQTRLSGEPYLIHPLEVAGILCDMKMDTASVATGILHDTVEDTFVTIEEIEEHFGAEIASLVNGLTKISKISFGTAEEKQAENFRKMILAMAKDIRVILIRLADRLHNMKTLEYHTPDNRKKIARETLDIYAPLASRLGIDWIKIELQDLSLKYQNSKAYLDIKKQLALQTKEKEEYISEVNSIISKKLVEYGLKAKIDGRPKHIYSVYRKMKAQKIEFGQIYDLIAFRIILASIKECYEALGIIHTLWKPVPGRFKDFIAMPKLNMYQSLHTTVIGPHGRRVEIQIRTREMHRIAEEGIAAHWKYKEKGDIGNKYDEQFAWIRQLVEWQQDLKNPREFLETVKIDLFPDEVYVFTPRGDVKQFPKGSTPVDFAYSIHTDVGNHCAGAKVAGKIVTLRYQLKSGDTIEIITNSHQRPSRDWLKFVRTSRAKTKIKSQIKTEERENSIIIGREMCEKEFRKRNLNYAKLLKSDELQKVAREFSFQTVEDLIVEVGYGEISPRQIINKMLPPETVAEKTFEENDLTKLKETLGREGRGGVIIDGMTNLLVNFGQCCHPLPGDKIVGFITRGRGVTIHTLNCHNVAGVDPERKVKAKWRKEESLHPVQVKVVCEDKPGLLAAISNSFASMSINISNVQVKNMNHNKAVCVFLIQVKDLKQLDSVFSSIKKVKMVDSVVRLRKG